MKNLECKVNRVLDLNNAINEMIEKLHNLGLHVNKDCYGTNLLINTHSNLDNLIYICTNDLKALQTKLDIHTDYSAYDLNEKVEGYIKSTIKYCDDIDEDLPF